MLPFCRISEANRRMMEGDFVRALEYYEQAIDEGILVPEVFMMAARLSIKCGKSTKSLEYLRRAEEFGGEFDYEFESILRAIYLLDEI